MFDVTTIITSKDEANLVDKQIDNLIYLPILLPSSKSIEWISWSTSEREDILIFYYFRFSLFYINIYVGMLHY